MAYMHQQALPNFCYGAAEAGYGTQGYTARENPAYSGSLGAPAGMSVPQEPYFIGSLFDDDLQQSPAPVLSGHGVAPSAPHSTAPGCVVIGMADPDKAMDKMLAKLQGMGKARQGEYLPMTNMPLEPQANKLDINPYGIKPYQVSAYGGMSPPLDMRSWRAHDDWAGGIKQVSDRSQDSTTNSGGNTKTNTFDSLPSLNEHDHHHSLVLPNRMLGSPAKPGPQGMTTLMVRNVPVMYTQQLLLKEFNNRDGAYDFLYLPRSSVGQTNLSFAFINFVSEAKAMAFKARWHKQRMARFTARKPLNIGFADVQGLRANILQVTKKRPSGCEAAPRNLPYILVNGVPMGSDEALAILRH